MSSLLDDSDDDSLTEIPTFTSKRKRSEERSRENAMKYMDDALEVENDRRERQLRILKIKQEQPEPDEERIRRAENMATEEYVSAGATRKLLQNAISGVEEHEVDDGLDHERRTFLASAFTTHRSILVGMRRTLAGVQDTKQLYSSEKDAMDHLKKVLKQMERSSNEAELKMAKKMHTAIRCDLLNEFLEARTLAINCQKYKVQNIPRELEEWLFKAACSAGRGDLQNRTGLCIGSFQTLLAVWKVVVSPRTEDSIMVLSSLVPWMEECFGLKLNGLAVNPNGGDDTDNTSTEEIHLNPIGLTHFLRLWVHAVEGRCFVAPSVDVVETIATCIVALARAGLDPAFHCGERYDAAFGG